MHKSTLTWAEAGTVTAICFGLFILFALQAAVEGFPAARVTDDGNLLTVGLELVLGGFGLLYLRLRQFELRALLPQPTVRDSLLGLGVAAAAWLGAWVVMLAVHSPGQREMVEFSTEGASTLSLVMLSVVNGGYEEVFLLGVLARGLRGFGLSVAVGLPLLVRVLYHVYQGPLGVVAVGTVGLVLTLAYVATGRLWPAVFAHILLDLAALL